MERENIDRATETEKVLILGCGNVLFGDDGFGCAVATSLESVKDIPSSVRVIEAGTGAREILFDLILKREKPRMVVIVDAVDCGAQPGTVFQLDVESLPENKRDDFSIHLLPASDLLRELRDSCGVDVRIVACQVGRIPERVEMGLSESIRNAIPEACALAMELASKCLRARGCG